MKKTIRKVLGSTIALVLSFSLFGCSSQEAIEDPKTVLEDAGKKMQELDSMTLKADIEINMSAGEDDSSAMSFKMPMSMTMEIAGMKGDLIYHTSVDAELMGMSIKTEQTYFDGVLYSEMEDQKTFMTVDASEASKTVSIGKVNEDFENMKASKEGDKIVITIQPTADELEKVMQMLGNAIEDELFAEDMLEAMSSIKFDAIKVVVNADGYVESEEISLSAESDGVKATISVKVEMSGFNSTAVEKVDPSEYENADDMFDFDDWDLDE